MSIFSSSVFYILSENNENTVENISINTNEEILQFLLVMCPEMGDLFTIIKYLSHSVSCYMTWCDVTWSDKVESVRHENQNCAVSLDGDRGFNENTESSPKKKLEPLEEWQIFFLENSEPFEDRIKIHPLKKLLSK